MMVSTPTMGPRQSPSYELKYGASPRRLQRPGRSRFRDRLFTICSPSRHGDESLLIGVLQVVGHTSWLSPGTVPRPVGPSGPDSSQAGGEEQEWYHYRTGNSSVAFGHCAELCLTRQPGRGI